MKKFWIVLHAEGRLPQGFKRHESREEADQEAKRLAVQDRSAFLVLETVTGFQPPMNVEEIDLTDE
jgi:hypothetical protein